MPVKLSISDIASIIIGTTPITKVYHGTGQVYPELTKVWVYTGTTGSADVSTVLTGLSLCKLFTITAALNKLETDYPAANQTVGDVGLVEGFDTATPFPNDCGDKYFEVQYE